jgi:hypothetical protein
MKLAKTRKRRKIWIIWKGDNLDNVVCRGSEASCVRFLRARGQYQRWRRGKSDYHMGYDL